MIVARHRMAGLVCLLLLLLSVATAAMWVRSYWVADRIMLAPLGDVALAAKSDRGRVALVEYTPWDNREYTVVAAQHWMIALLMGLVAGVVAFRGGAALRT